MTTLRGMHEIAIGNAICSSDINVALYYRLRIRHRRQQHCRSSNGSHQTKFSTRECCSQLFLAAVSSEKRLGVFLGI